MQASDGKLDVMLRLVNEPGLIPTHASVGEVVGERSVKGADGKALGPLEQAPKFPQYTPR